MPRALPSNGPTARASRAAKRPMVDRRGARDHVRHLRRRAAPGEPRRSTIGRRPGARPATGTGASRADRAATRSAACSAAIRERASRAPIAAEAVAVVPDEHAPIHHCADGHGCGAGCIRSRSRRRAIDERAGRAHAPASLHVDSVAGDSPRTGWTRKLVAAQRTRSARAIHDRERSGDRHRARGRGPRVRRGRFATGPDAGGARRGGEGGDAEDAQHGTDPPRPARQHGWSDHEPYLGPAARQGTVALPARSRRPRG